VRSRSRVARIGLVALALPVALTLAACDGTNSYKAAVSTAAALPAGNSGSVQATACPQIESAWGKFKARERLLTPKSRPNYAAYDTLDTALLATLTGNRDFQFTEDVDSLASAADLVESDHGQGNPTHADWVAFKAAALPVAKDCGTTLVVPTLIPPKPATKTKPATS
jgi:hypothetical protein